MVIDETVKIAEKFHIEFPKSIDIVQAKQLLDYAARELPVHIESRYSYYETIGETREEYPKDSISSPAKKTFCDIEGKITVSSGKNKYKFDFFKFKHPKENLYQFLFSGIQFRTSSASENNNEYLLYDDVRNVVSQYFNNQDIIERMHQDRSR